MLSAEFCRREGIMSCEHKADLPSKKNKVSLYRLQTAAEGEKHWVVKRFAAAIRCKKEAEILAVLATAGVAVPRLIFAADNYLILEYIPGRTLLAWLEETEGMKEGQQQTDHEPVAEQLSDWLVSCYAALEQVYGEPHILWDVQLRNFLLADRLYGLDFEECKRGRPETDIGRLFAFILTYHPPFTACKFDFVAALRASLVPRLPLSWQLVADEADREFTRMQKRRPHFRLPGESGCLVEQVRRLLY
ncbi:MAG TPA: phosphotransferase [Firmicutes bacterium]|nr:phosphotransferase [Bacillota bacterium]